MGCLIFGEIYILCRKFGNNTFLTDKYRIVVLELTDKCGIRLKETDIYRILKNKNKTFMGSNGCF